MSDNEGFPAESFAEASVNDGIADNIRNTVRIIVRESYRADIFAIRADDAYRSRPVFLYI